MSRRTKNLKPSRGLAALVLGALLSACGVPQEQSVLDKFFAASRLRDKTALAGLSTVIFEPLERGIVVDYTISKVVPDGNTKRVTVSAHVKRPDGQTVPRTLIVLMQRRGEGSDWIISGVTDIGASGT